jgi:hypothetical protein
MEPVNKKYTNTSAQVLRFALDNRDYVVGPGQSFTAPATPYTQGLVARKLATVEDIAPAPEQAAGPVQAAPAAPTAPVEGSTPEAPSSKNRPR